MKRKGGIMARFYGSMSGSAEKRVTRSGNAVSGVKAVVSGWDIGGKVEVFDRGGKDVVVLQLTGGSNNPILKETPWIEVCQDRKTGSLSISIRPGKEGRVLKW
jgi:hypothetical protein